MLKVAFELDLLDLNLSGCNPGERLVIALHSFRVSVVRSRQSPVASVRRETQHNGISLVVPTIDVTGSSSLNDRQNKASYAHRNNKRNIIKSFK